MLDGILYSAAALALIAWLVTIHEFGHFLAARACGVHVRVFSIGIGNRLFGVRWRGTDYRVSWIPFGGYVRMAGADPMGDGFEEEDLVSAPGSGFMSKPPWQRLIIVGAGPAMNLLLPFVVFTALMVAGEPQPRSDVGNVRPGTPADLAGVALQDRLTAVNGVPVTTWVDVLEAFDSAPSDPVTITVDRAGSSVTMTLDLATDAELPLDPWTYGFGNTAPDTTLVIDDPSSPAGRSGLRTGDRIVDIDGVPTRDLNDVRRILTTTPGGVDVHYHREATPADSAAGTPATHAAVLGAARLEPRAAWSTSFVAADDALYRLTGLATATVGVASFGEDAPAKAAGLLVGDRILAVDDSVVRTWGDVVLGVAASATGAGDSQTVRPVVIHVRRSGVMLDVPVTPEVIQDTDEMGRYRFRPVIGVGGTGGFLSAPLIPRPYPLVQASARASRETALVAGFIIEQLGKLTTGEASPKESLGGPVEIFRQTRAAAERGIFDWARHMGLFSISLGIINLLPIPVLDGGQFMIYVAEWVRGRPLPLLLRERMQQVGVIFLVLLMMFVFVFDINRAIQG